MSMLDSLYFQSRILGALLKKEDFERYIKNKKINGEYIKGYYYLIEVTVNALINEIEFLIKDENVYDFIHYQNIGLKDIPKVYRKLNKELCFIEKLEICREKLSKIRKEKTTHTNQENLLKEFNKIIEEIDNYFLSSKRAKINLKNKEKENFNFIIELTNKQNYIEVDFDSFRDDSEPIPLYPACNYYNLGYNKVHGEYHLQNPKIKKQESEYLKGYSGGLAFIYESIGIVPPDLIRSLCKVKSWIELHKIGSKIYDKLIRKNKINIMKNPIFEEIESTEIAKLNKPKIDYKDLKFLFRDRRVFVIEPKEKGYPTEIVPFFISLASGRKNFDDVTEIIEIKIRKKDNEVWYSYAIFIPHGGALWNGSYWVLFKDIAFEHGNYKTDGKTIIGNYLNKKEFSIHKHELDNKILEKYLRESDLNYKKREKVSLMLKESNSLLVELLSLYYSIKKQEKLIDFEWGIEIKDDNKKSVAEADLIFYFEKKVLIIQAKTNLYNTADELIKHFERIKIFLEGKRKDKIKNRLIEKEIFVFFKCEQEDIKKIKKLGDNSIKVIFFEEILERNPSFLTANVKNKLNMCLKKDF